jgi:AAA15 family ATPase/GTPase
MEVSYDELMEDLLVMETLPHQPQTYSQVLKELKSVEESSIKMMLTSEPFERVVYPPERNLDSQDKASEDKNDTLVSQDYVLEDKNDNLVNQGKAIEDKNKNVTLTSQDNELEEESQKEGEKENIVPVTSSISPSFLCQLCSKNYSCKKSLKRHIYLQFMRKMGGFVPSALKD